MAGTLTASVIKNDTTSPTTFQNSLGTEIGTLCRAWVNFNGTSTVAIRASFNVTSITDNGTGNYTVNFTNSFANANYAVNATGDWSSGVRTATCCVNDATPPATGSCELRIFDGVTAKDFSYVMASFFR